MDPFSNDDFATFFQDLFLSFMQANMNVVDSSIDASTMSGISRLRMVRARSVRTIREDAYVYVQVCSHNRCEEVSSCPCAHVRRVPTGIEKLSMMHNMHSLTFEVCNYSHRPTIVMHASTVNSVAWAIRYATYKN